MVRVAGSENAVQSLKSQLLRFVAKVGGAILLVWFVYASLTARVAPNHWGVALVRVGFKQGIGEKPFGAGLYFVPPGTRMYTFPREIHVLEATNEEQESRARARSADTQKKVEEYFARRNQVLEATHHRVVDALQVQTSDGYSVITDVTLLYSIQDAVAIAKSFGWGSAYVERFVINSFRNGVLATLGKMNAEDLYDEQKRIAAVTEAESLLQTRFARAGFKVEKLLLRNYRFADTYEKALHDKKVAVQLTEKNRKESLANEQRAMLRQIESKGNASITIAESEVQARIAKVRAEAELYSSQTRAKADTEVNVAAAEAKRLKAEALTQSGGRYVVALETAKMFDNISGAVMSPEQYSAFIRNAWALIGVSSAGPVPAQPSALPSGGR